MTVFPAISITEVGVATRSLTRNTSVNTANEHISIPDPPIEENIPPRNPHDNSTKRSQVM